MSTKGIRIIDLRGLSSTISVFEVSRAMIAVEQGEILEALVTDSEAIPDIKNWTEDHGYVFVLAQKKDDYMRIIIKRIN